MRLLLKQVLWGGSLLCSHALLLAGSQEPAHLPGSRPFADRYHWRQWKVEDGLPENTIQSIIQSHDGYLWLATHRGFARFDGVRFTCFDRSNTPLLPSDNCIALAEDAEHALWIGTAGGALRWNAGEQALFTTNAGLCHNRIWSLSASHDGGIWIATEAGINRFFHGSLSKVFDARSTIITEGEDRTAWFWSDDSVYELKEEKSWPIGPGRGTTCITSDQAGVAWWGSSEGLYQFRDGRVTLLGSPDSGWNGGLSCVYADRAGNIWSGSRGGKLYVFRDGQFTEFPSRGRVKGGIRCLQEDREGSLWLGTESSGLVQLANCPILSFPQEDGPLAGPATAVASGADGSLWVASQRGLARLHHGQFDAWPATNHSFYFDTAESIVVDSSGLLWGATGGAIRGVSLFRAGQWQLVFPTNELPWTLFADHSGDLWAGFSQHLFRCHHSEITSAPGQSAAWQCASNWSAFKDAAGRWPASVRAILQDNDGTLWFGTSADGLWHLVDGRFAILTTHEGLPDNFIQCLCEDSHGALWIGTRNGLCRRTVGRLDNFGIRQGLCDTLINSIQIDHAGNLWMGCSRGLLQVNREELDAVATGRLVRAQCLIYGEADGMPNVETCGDQQNASFKDRNGHLWFATEEGVVTLDPADTRATVLPPPVAIEQVIADGRAIFSNATCSQVTRLTIPPGGARVLEIHYTANHFLAPNKIRFKYKLEGHDSNWQEDESNRRVGFYTDLPPGRYQFRVCACDCHGAWNETGAALAFELLPHYYQTSAFYGAMSLAALAIIGGFHSLRVRRLARLQGLERAQALELERSRIARDIHDELGSRLTQLGVLGELASRNLEQSNPASPYLDKLRRTAREIHESLDETVWAVNPLEDSLAGLLSYLRDHAIDFFSASNIRCRFDFPNPTPDYRLSAQTRHNVFLAIKEVLNNVSKHSAATEVWLRLQAAGEFLELSVEDNGRGLSRTSDNAEHNAAYPARDGYGLVNLRARAAKIGGSLSIQGRLGGGTLVILRIPTTSEQPAPAKVPSGIPPPFDT